MDDISMLGIYKRRAATFETLHEKALEDLAQARRRITMLEHHMAMSRELLRGNRVSEAIARITGALRKGK